MARQSQAHLVPLARGGGDPRAALVPTTWMSWVVSPRAESRLRQPAWLCKPPGPVAPPADWASPGCPWGRVASDPASSSARGPLRTAVPHLPTAAPVSAGLAPSGGGDAVHPAHGRCRLPLPQGLCQPWTQVGEGGQALRAQRR